MIFVLICKISSWRNTMKEKEQNLMKFVLQSDLMTEKKMKKLIILNPWVHIGRIFVSDQKTLFEKKEEEDSNRF